ncbi:MAG: DMT family transporter [Desulfomonilaceae bacterium]
MTYLYLAIAIVSEVIATSALKAAQGFTKPVPSLIVVAGYISAFYFLSVVVKGMHLGVAYAIWCGLAIVLVALAGIFVYKQVPDLPAILGMGLIIAGVIIMNVFSKTVSD